MNVFSIDLAAERIFDPRTRNHFTEVTRSFSNECYRSSVVMLWTTIVCDLVFKLQALRDLYGDPAAGKLLDDVEIKRESNPNSPDWELFLLDEVAIRTKMLEKPEHTQLQHLQKLRHLSAHPVLTGTDLLFSPTKEDTRAQIRLALEAVLLKPPLFSKRIVETLVEDIASNKDVLLSRQKLKAYLEARYLPNMPRSIEIELFRALWKFSFKLNNADTISNRKVNLDTLAILFSRNPAAMREAIDSDRPYFSNVGPGADPLDALVDFLSDHPNLYASLDPAAHVLIDGRLEADINNLSKARFKALDMASFIADIQAKGSKAIADMSSDVWASLLTGAEEEDAVDEAARLVTMVYGESPSFDAADRRFTRFVEPTLPKFTAATMDELLSKIDDNLQTYGRGRASVDHPQIKAFADVLAIDTTKYKNFTKYL